MTLTTTQAPFISLNVVLSLKVSSVWPVLPNGGLPVQTWLGTRVRQGFYQQPYYLVPKYQGKGTRQVEGICARGEFISWQHTHIIGHVSNLASQFNSTLPFGCSFLFQQKKKIAEINFLIHTDTWQLSFSNIEEAILINHGLKKTCCEADGDPCCRLECFQLSSRFALFKHTCHTT